MATVLIGAWTNTIDRDQMTRTLNGQSPFNEETLGEELLYEDEIPHPNGALAGSAAGTDKQPTGTH